MEADKYTKTLLREGVIGQEIVMRKDVCDIDIEKIATNPNQPRIVFDAKSLEELAASIKKHGILEPIMVRPKDNAFEVVAGERRLRAAKEADLKMVPCIIREMSDNDAFIIALTENVQRDDLTPVDEANSYQKMLERGIAKSQRDIAALIGVSHTRIQQKMNLLNLEPSIRDKVATRVATRKDEDKITEGHARHLLKVKDPELQIKLFDQVTAKGLSVRELEGKVARILSPPPKKEKPKTDILYEDETVKVKSTDTGFDIKVSCKTQDELAACLRRLLKKITCKEARN